MKSGVERFLYWAPRVLCGVFALFLGIFALDVFGEGRGFWGTAMALMMHLIPSFLVLGLLAISWRWEWVGGAVFPLLGVLYLVTSWGKFHWSAYAAISGPLFLVGGLFLAHFATRRAG